MSTKHTPGPWAFDSEGCVFSCDDNGPVHRVAYTYFLPDVAPVASHNARLIAAAPDLLEALLEATRCLAWHARKHPAGMDTTAVRKARAAIAKATGEAA